RPSFLLWRRACRLLAVCATEPSPNNERPAMIRKLKFTSIPVQDQDRALAFYVNALGSTLVTDQPMGPGQRWIELRPPKGGCRRRTVYATGARNPRRDVHRHLPGV